MAGIVAPDGITLMGGGPVDSARAHAALARAPMLVCADGGADHAARLGLSPAAVIGDMDSASHAAQTAAGTSVHVVADQNSTDFEKCLMTTEADFYLGVGFLGGRLDHSLAALNAMTRYPKRIMLLGEEELALHIPREIAMPLPPRSRVSLFPLAEVTGTFCKGLEWDVNGLTMAPGGRIGTSNRMAESRLELAFDRRGMILLLPLVAMESALEAMRAMPI